MDYIVKQIKKWKKGEKPFPKIIQLHLTNRCNLNCDFCPTEALKEERDLDFSKELSKERWQEIIKAGNKMGVKEWHICGGGEPLFYTSDALDLMDQMKENGARGEIITNGTLLDKNSCRRLIGIGWDLVTFSLDGPSKEINDRIRDEGSFKQAVKNAKILSTMRKSKKPLLRIHTVICNQNHDKIREMVELTDRIGFDEIKFNAMNVWSEAGSKLKLSQKQIEEAKQEMDKAKEVAKRLNVETNIEQFLENDILENADEMDMALKQKSERSKKGFNNLNCYYPWYNLAIFADGRAAPCFLFHEGVSLKNKSLEEVWFSDFFKEIRESFTENKLKETCKNCNAWNVEKMEEIRRGLRGN